MDERHDIHLRPLIDPLLFEQAGRALRRWLDGLLAQQPAQTDTSIAWEDGESDSGRMAPLEH
jgi:hypothetical protein